jgi:ribosomal protein L13
MDKQVKHTVNFVEGVDCGESVYYVECEKVIYKSNNINSCLKLWSADGQKTVINVGRVG